MGEAELDASVMDGASGRGGAVAAVRHVRNPARLAHAVMEHTGHVMLAGRGAFEFAPERGLPVAPQAYFRRPPRMVRVGSEEGSGGKECGRTCTSRWAAAK